MFHLLIPFSFTLTWIKIMYSSLKARSMGCAYWLRSGWPYLELGLGLSSPHYMNFTEKKEPRMKLELLLPIKVGINVANTRLAPSLFKGTKLDQKIFCDLCYDSLYERAWFPHVYLSERKLKLHGWELAFNMYIASCLHGLNFSMSFMRIESWFICLWVNSHVVEQYLTHGNIQ